MDREKVTCKTELEFVTEVANACVANMKVKDKMYIMDNPCIWEYHFGYAMYIRNHYIHNRDFSEVEFWAEPDHLSSRVMEMIFSILLPEYEYDNRFFMCLYSDRKFGSLRRRYKEIYGDYPVEHVLKYKDRIPKVSEGEYYFPKEEIEGCIKTLADELWDEKGFKQQTKEWKILIKDVAPLVKTIKHIFEKEGIFIPLQVAWLLFQDKIEKEECKKYKRILKKILDDKPSLVEILEQRYFEDKALARAVLKYGRFMEYLPMYQNDDQMVKYTLSHGAGAIKFIDKHYLKDRELIILAIKNSRHNTIMYYEQMKPYRKDKELVYMACQVDPWNFVYVDKTFRDDFELAKICLMQDDPNHIFGYMSKRLRDNKELAMLECDREYSNIEDFSKRLKDDDDIAQRLFEKHGLDYHFYDMSKRIQKKYGYECK